LHHRSEPHTNSHADFNKSERTGASESRSAPRDRVRAGFAAKTGAPPLPPELFQGRQNPFSVTPLVLQTALQDIPRVRLQPFGDAYFIRDEMALDGYSCTPMLRASQRLMAADNATRLLNQTRLRELKRVHGRKIRLFCAHDARELEELSSARLQAAPIIPSPLTAPA
jgi:hypothetical protein